MTRPETGIWMTKDERTDRDNEIMRWLDDTEGMLTKSFEWKNARQVGERWRKGEVTRRDWVAAQAAYYQMILNKAGRQLGELAQSV